MEDLLFFGFGSFLKKKPIFQALNKLIFDRKANLQDQVLKFETTYWMKNYLQTKTQLLFLHNNQLIGH